MRFLGGLLKALAILILIAATVICTVIAVEAELTEAYVAMGLCWLAAVFVVLSILGTGIALTQVSKLKKRLKQLEQNAGSNAYIFAPARAARETAPRAEEVYTPAPKEPEPEQVAAPAPAAEEPKSLFIPQEADSSFNSPLPQPSKRSMNWLPAVITAGIAVIAIAAVVLIMGGRDVPGKDPDANVKATTSPKETTKPGKDSDYSDAVEVKMGSELKCDIFRMTFESLELLDEYTHEITDYYSYSPFVEEGYKLLMMRGRFENLSTSKISSSAFKLIATVNGEYVVDDFGVSLNFMRNNTYECDPYTEVEYLLCMNVPEKLAAKFEEVTFTIGFKDDMTYPTVTWNSDGTTSYDINNWYCVTSGLSGGSGTIVNGNGNKKEAKPIALGDKIITDDYEFTLTDVELTYEVLPPKTNSVYSSYVAASGKVYVHVAADVKNTMQRDIRIDELYDAAVLYDGKYPYSGFIAVDDENRFDWVGSYVAATPLETCGTHAIIECPVEVDTSGKSITVTLIIGDTAYEYTLR